MEATPLTASIGYEAFSLQSSKDCPGTGASDQLVRAVQGEYAVLFLGAGASYGALHPLGASMPGGNQLRDALADHFLAGQSKQHSLDAVADFAVSAAGLLAVQTFIKTLLKEFRPAPHQNLISDFKWHGIATTNYDRIVEDVYSKVPSPTQRLIPFVKDDQPVQTEAKKDSRALLYLKLDGCIDHDTDLDIPFVLAPEQYANYSRHRTRPFLELLDGDSSFPSFSAAIQSPIQM